MDEDISAPIDSQMTPETFNNPNIYLKLINSSSNFDLLGKHMGSFSVDSLRNCMYFLIRHSKTMSLVVNTLLSLDKNMNSDKRSKMLMNLTVKTIDARHVSIYQCDPSSPHPHFSVHRSTWVDGTSKKIDCDALYGGEECLMSRKGVNLFDLKKQDLKSKSRYATLEPSCVLSRPILSDGGHIIGMIEMIDRTAGLPFFNAEDELYLDVLCNLWRSLLKVSHEDEETETSNSKSNFVHFLDKFRELFPPLNTDFSLNLAVGKLRESVRMLFTAQSCDLIWKKGVARPSSTTPCYHEFSSRNSEPLSRDDLDRDSIPGEWADWCEF